MSNCKTSNKERVKIPQIIGHEKSGTVAAIGSGVTGLAIGAAVVVRPLDNRAETSADRGYIRRNLKFRGIDFFRGRSKIPGPSASLIWTMREKSEGRPQ
jgi:threonine dehydrogenase-like Zn-dependent dehydrogenase